jgi:hypothetical protein
MAETIISVTGAETYTASLALHAVLVRTMEWLASGGVV